RRFTAVHDQISADARWNKLTDCLRRTRHDVPDERNRDIRHECQIKFIGREGQDARRAIADDLELDRVEIRATRLPVCRIPRQLDRRVRIVCRELEWTCSDRLCAHVLRRYVAWVDWREVRCEQGWERSLRSLQDEGRLEIPIDCHLPQVVPPDLARVLAKLIGIFALDLVPSALNILGTEGRAVVPLDASAECERESGAGGVPCPALSEFWDDGVEPIAGLRLVEDKKIIEHA